MRALLFAAWALVAAHGMVGQDRDEHGCIPSAGYSWCRGQCLRLWDFRLAPEDCDPQTERDYSEERNYSEEREAGIAVIMWKYEEEEK
jgi:hypothetical protein